MSSHHHRVLIPVAGVAVLLGCSGGGSETSEVSTAARNSGDTEPAVVTATSSDAAGDEATASTTSSQAADLLSAITLMTGGRLVLLAPDLGCVDEQLSQLPVAARRTEVALRQDPWAAGGIDPAAKEPVFDAVIGCIGPEVLRRSVVLSLLRVNDVECVVDAWDGLLTGDVVASSLAHGTGLDDLSDDLVDAMASAAADCAQDPAWWIDDILFQDEIPFDLAEHEMRCVATRYIATLGVEEVIRRRLLGAPLLAVPADEEARLDLPTHCDVTERSTLDLLVATTGECVHEYGGTEPAQVIGCDRPHNAEVYASHDLTDDHPTWPGAEAIRATAETLCDGSRTGSPPDGSGPHDVAVVYPLRRAWERGDRSVLCLVVHGRGGVWTGSSGVVPAATVPSTTTTSTATAPAPPTPPDTTVPPGAREMFTLDEVDRAGMCIYRAPALPGQDDLERRFFDVDCAVPHQVEMYHRFDVAGAPGAPYPGEGIIDAQGNDGCTALFETYVGIPYEQSRLRFTYFYPSPETWRQGDRSVICLLLGSEIDEMLTRSMAGSRE